MKYLIIFLSFLFSLNILGQELQSEVEFMGDKIQILQVEKANAQATGKLSTGEIINSGCDRGVCYVRIEYKGRSIEQRIGVDITKMTVYEFDFGEDGDNEIVVVNDFKGTSYIFVFAYSRGIILKLFEKEIMNYRTVLKKDYIEYYLPGGLDKVWNYYQGQFWEMTPYESKKT